MNEITSAIREKYPQYAEMGDDDLTLAIAAKYPTYLKNKSFADDVGRLQVPKLGAPVNRSGLTEPEQPEGMHIAPGEAPLARPSLISALGTGLTAAGKGLKAGLADVGDIMVSELQAANEKAGVTDPVIGPLVPHPFGENLEAFRKSHGLGPLPAEEPSTLPKPFQIGQSAAQGLLESTPRLAAVTAAQSLGVPAPLAAGAVFGATPQGFDVKQGAIAAALPFVGKYSGQMVEALAGKLGVSNAEALNIFNKLGGAAGAAGYLKTIDESEIAKLPSEQRDQARIESWANIAGQAALGMLGTEKSNPDSSVTMAGPLAVEKGELNAPQERTQPENNQPEHQGTGEQRPPPETGGGNRPEPGTEQKPQTPPNVPPLQVSNRADVLDLAQSELPIEQRGPQGGNVSTFGMLDPAAWKPLIDSASENAKEASKAVYEAGKEAIKGRPLTPLRKSVLEWSAKLQRSFGESSKVQQEIRRVVKDELDREGITNWIQANGDPNVLKARALASKTPELRKGYEAALKLSPDAIKAANQIKAKYGDLFKRGQFYDVIKSFRDDYVTQIWDLGKGVVSGTGSSRTLRDRFKFSKARTFNSFFDGEQAGFKPKTKDISKLLPVYMHEMEHVISARQLAEELSRGTASDGRPLAVPKGVGIPVSGSGSRATLVMPKASKSADVSDYKVLEGQPALSDWRWVAKDDQGNPTFLKADLALHPEAYAKLKNILGRSAIREWYDSKGSALSVIPKALVKGLDIGQSEVKRTMLGLLTPFHQVQEGTHAIGHRVNPTFNIPKIDLMRTEQMDAARHGLMLLPDKTSADQFMEGFRQSGIVSRLPIIGPAADWYSNYLFHEYIPGLKFKTYEAIVGRNMKVYADDLATGKATEADVKVLSAEQTNAAYGHLNYSDLGRNPTIQHLMQVGLLAPDFLEARGRFFGQAVKGLTGAKAGREQLLALGTLAVAQAVGAWTAAQVSGGQWDPKHPFEVVKDNRRYTLRSVPEDIYRLVKDTRAFVYARLNPIVGRGAVQYISGVDWRGQKKTAVETTKELAQAPIPLMLRPLVGASNTPLKWWEEMLSAVGLKMSRYSAQQDVRDMVDKFKRDSGNKKLIAEAERASKEVFPDSDYKPLREALIKGNDKDAESAYAKLLETKKPLDIEKAMRPFSSFRIPGTNYFGRHNKAFTHNVKVEHAFIKSLSEDQKKIYDEAVSERKAVYDKFRAFLKTRNEKQITPPGSGVRYPDSV